MSVSDGNVFFTRVSHRFHGFTRIVFLGLKKTDINPLKSMGALPWCLPSDFVL